MAIFERDYQNFGSKVVARRQISGQKCGRRSLKRGGRLIQLQIIVKIVGRVSKWSLKIGGS